MHLKNENKQPKKVHIPMKFKVIIPARYGSSRFPGKPLAMLGGVEMIVRVCRQAAKACPDVVVATDDERILKCVEANGFKAVMTSSDHRSGTDRVCEAMEKCGADADVVINVQGDEPFIDPGQIRLLMEAFSNPETRIATLARPFNKELGFEALFDPNKVKVTFSDKGKALYFSRSIIPYVRGAEWTQWLDRTVFYTHIGIYAYRAETLRELTKLPQSSLELAESLEQLRWLQAGYAVHVGVSKSETIGIDTPEDLARAEEFLKKIAM